MDGFILDQFISSFFDKQTYVNEFNSGICWFEAVQYFIQFMHKL